MRGLPEGAGEHRLVVDRLEGELVVVEVEGGPVLDLPRWLLPAGVREGDVVWARTLERTEGELRLELRLDPAATRAAREAVRGRVERLRARDPGGDIDL